MMMLNRISYPWAVGVAVVATLSLIGIGRASLPRHGSHPSASHAVDASATTAKGHLYVADQTAGAVYRFPLASDGLPSNRPDSVLYGGLTTPFGLAIDRVGHLFVSDQTAHGVF